MAEHGFDFVVDEGPFESWEAIAAKYSKAQGAYVPPEYRADYALKLLTSHYYANSKFMEELSELHTHHRDVVHQLKCDAPLRRGLKIPFTPSACQYRNLDMAQVHPMLKELVSDAVMFALEWGLNALWAPGLLVWNLIWGHQCGDDLGKEVWLPRFTGILAVMYEPAHEEIPPPEWNAGMESEADADQKWKDYKRAVKERYEWLGMKRNGGKSALEDHVQWLYWSICPDPGKGRPLRFSEIVDGFPPPRPGDALPGEDTVGKAVRALAITLGLALRG